MDATWSRRRRGLGLGAGVQVAGPLSGFALGDQRRAAHLRRFAARDRVDELDGLRDLVRREPRLRVGDDFAGGRWSVRLGRFDDGMDATTPLWIAEPDHD